MNATTFPTYFPTAKFFGDVGDFMFFFKTLMILVASIIFLFTLLFGAMTILRAGGDSSQVEKGRNIITYAIIGLIVIVLSTAIVSILSYFLNINFKI